MRIPAAAAVVTLLTVPAVVIAQQQDYALPEAQPGAAPLAPLEPKPALRRAAVIEEVSGRVTYRLPGQARDRSLDGPTSVGMGTIVDTRSGRVELTVEADEKGATSTGEFFDGRFRVSQGAGSKPITHLRLLGAVTDCGAQARAAATKKRRRLWGDGKGRFRTRGRYSAATVRGTKWLVEDRCDGTLTRVARGEVEVIDYAPLPVTDQAPTETGGGTDGGGQAPAAAPQRGSGPRKVRVRKGGSYVARPG